MALSAFDGPRRREQVERPLPAPGDELELVFAGASWTVGYEQRDCPGRPDAVEGRLRFRVREGRAEGVNASVVLTVSGWSDRNFVMLPAAAYNGNRYRVRPMRYPPRATDPEDLRPEADTMITDVPRLELDPDQPSYLHLNTGDETTPALTFQAPEPGVACIFLTDQGGVYGNHGVVVSEEAGRATARLSIEAPCVRPKLYRGMHSDRPSWDRGATLAAGDEITIRFRRYVFAAETVQALYDRFAEVRGDLAGAVAVDNVLPFSAAWALLELKYNQHNWNPDGFYTVGIRESWEKDDRAHSDWQSGWVGGGMSTLPLLFQGTPESHARAVRTLDFLFTRGTSPAGMPYGIYHAGRPASDDYYALHDSRWVLVRKLGDVLYFAGKQVDLLRRQDPAWRLPDAWSTGIRRLAEGLIGVFDRYGQLGQFLDWETWEILVGGSTAGAMVPGGLALAGDLLEEPVFVDGARRIGRYFADSHVRRGVTTGGPGEILQGPDSESAFALLESLVVLYEVTGDAAWLAPAVDMANQCLTWCASYDYQFPPDSELGRYGVRGAGSVWANVQNKHSAPGICTLSGDSLFKLWRATGHDHFLEEIRRIAHSLPQYLCREDRPMGDPERMKPGFVCERVNFSDWEGEDRIGGNLFGSCWPEVTLMLTTVEIPGIYVQPDVRRVVVFDHVDVVAQSTPDGDLHLRVSNPTGFEAVVRILVENAGEACTRPLGPNALWGAPTVTVPAGGTVTVPVSSR